MVEELAHRIDALPAGRASAHHYAPSTFRDGRRFVNEVREVVAVDFRVPFASVATRQL
jgi:hypothetical protein